MEPNMSADNVAGSHAGESDAIDAAEPAGPPSPLIDSLCQALRRGALPGELEGFSNQETRAAAEFIAACASPRSPGTATLRLESFGTQLGHRRMRIAMTNDDMPFLVDSVAGAIAARGLIIRRLLHPVVCVDRDAEGCLTAVEPLCDERHRRE
jgi:glutamate dehydrogenase